MLVELLLRVRQLKTIEMQMRLERKLRRKIKSKKKYGEKR